MPATKPTLAKQLDSENRQDDSSVALPELHPHLPGDESPSCPLCGVAGASEQFRKRGHPVFECRCGHRFALPLGRPGRHVETVYGDDYFFGGGAGYRDYLSEGRLLHYHGARYARLLRRWTEPGRMLDVGAAAGFLLRGFVDAGWDGRGVEPNAKMAEFARENLGLDVAASLLEDFHPDERFSLVTVIQVLAHFVDPRATVAALARLTQPGGWCLVETWNVQSWSAWLFGSNWQEYSPPSVLHWFSPAAVRKLFELAGFRFVAVGRPRKWVNVGHARSLLQYKADESVAVRGAAFLLRPIPEWLDLPYPSEDLFWMLLRKEG